MAVVHTRADGQERWLEFLDGVPAPERPPDWLEEAGCWLDEHIPGWEDAVILAALLGPLTALLAAAVLHP